MCQNRRGISFRRHQHERLKAKRLRLCYWGRGSSQCVTEWTPKHLGIAVNTPKRCSCFMCRNERQSFGETLAERRNSIVYQDLV